MRVNYQGSLWTKSHQPKPDLWNPDGSGWVKNPESMLLNPIYFINDTAPLEVRDLIHLYCTDNDCEQHRKCQCLSSGLFCTEICVHALVVAIEHMLTRIRMKRIKKIWLSMIVKRFKLMKGGWSCELDTIIYHNFHNHYYLIFFKLNIRTIKQYIN